MNNAIGNKKPTEAGFSGNGGERGPHAPQFRFARPMLEMTSSSTFLIPHYGLESRSLLFLQLDELGARGAIVNSGHKADRLVRDFSRIQASYTAHSLNAM